MTALHAPHIFINKYMEDKIAEFGLGVQFFPTLPADFDGLSDIDVRTETNGTLPGGQAVSVFDRMFKLRRSPFPHIKCEQVLYYFYVPAIDDLFKIQQQSQDLLDRGDESAEEMNNWIDAIWVSKGSHLEQSTGKPVLYFGETNPGLDANGNPDTTQDGWFRIPYFHEIKIFQLEESRDIVDFGTARTWAGNKLIIDYDWHSS